MPPPTAIRRPPPARSRDRRPRAAIRNRIGIGRPAYLLATAPRERNSLRARADLDGPESDTRRPTGHPATFRSTGVETMVTSSGDTPPPSGARTPSGVVKRPAEHWRGPCLARIDLRQCQAIDHEPLDPRYLPHFHPLNR